MTFRSLHPSDWIVKRLMMMISVKRAKFLNPHDIHWTGRLELYLVLLPYLVFYNKFSLISFLPFSRLPTLSFTKYKQKQRKPVSCVHIGIGSSFGNLLMHAVLWNNTQRRFSLSPTASVTASWLTGPTNRVTNLFRKRERNNINHGLVNIIKTRGSYSSHKAA